MEKKTTLSGNPPKTTDGPAPDMDKDSRGQHKDYWVLTEEERKKGFKRPVRESYRHKACDGQTRMATPIAETYARMPSFYTSTYCSHCGSHFPTDEFVWPDGEVVGT